MNEKFFEPKPITRWSYLNLTNKPLSKHSFTGFQNALKLCGMGREDPDPNGGFKALLGGNDDDNKNDKSIRDVMEKISKEKMEIVLVVLPVKSAPLYARVKYWADFKFGMI